MAEIILSAPAPASNTKPFDGILDLSRIEYRSDADNAARLLGLLQDAVAKLDEASAILGLDRYASARNGLSDVRDEITPDIDTLNRLLDAWDERAAA